MMLPRATVSDSGTRPLFRITVGPFNVTKKEYMIRMNSSSGMQDNLRPLHLNLDWSLDALGMVR